MKAYRSAYRVEQRFRHLQLHTAQTQGSSCKPLSSRDIISPVGSRSRWRISLTARPGRRNTAICGSRKVGIGSVGRDSCRGKRGDCGVTHFQRHRCRGCQCLEREGNTKGKGEELHDEGEGSGKTRGRGERETTGSLWLFQHRSIHHIYPRPASRILRN